MEAKSTSAASYQYSNTKREKKRTEMINPQGQVDMERETHKNVNLGIRASSAGIAPDILLYDR